MIAIIQELASRTNRIKIISDYFCPLEITKAAKENFKRTIREGRVLVRDLKLNFETNAKLIERIENFLIACEETLYAVGLEVLEMYCEIEEILEDFKDQRYLIMRCFNAS